MVKKTDRTIMWSIIIGVILIAGVIAIANAPKLPFFSLSGASTLSIDKVNLKSNNPYFSGESWLITFSGNPLGQSFYGSWDPSDIEDYTDGSLTTKEDFTIKIDYDDTKCAYPIKGTSLDDIKDIQLTEWTYIPWVNPCDETEARARQNNVVLYGKYGNSLTCFAIGYGTKAVVKDINNPDISADYRITIDAGDDHAYADFSTLDGKTSGPIGDFAYAVWNGNLDTGKACPSQARYLGAYVNGNWRIIDEDNYEDYDNAYDDMIRFTNQDAYADTVRRTVQTVQSLANTAKASTYFGEIRNAGSTTNAVVEVVTESPLQFPVTSVYIKASALGIYTPVPEFKIKSATSPCFKTGTEGTISLLLENVGETGGYTAYATCSGVFTGTRNAQGSINAGASKTVYIPLSATASKKETSACTVYVESTGKTVSKSVSVCVDPQITCEVAYPNKFCSNDATKVLQCSQDGATFNTLETCESGYVCDSGKCILDDGNGGGGFFNWFKNLFKGIGGFFGDLFSGVFGWLVTVKYIIIGIASILTLFISAGHLDRIKELSKRAWLRWTIAVIIAGAVAWVLYLFIGSFIFWIAVAGVIVYNVVFSQLRVFTNIRSLSKRKRR